MPQLDDVFGVTSRTVLSYVERPQVDDSFREALGANKQIIVYGSSKQGKTALVSKHLPYDENILVSLTPKTQVVDIYHAILSKAGVRLISSSTEKTGNESSASVGLRFKAIVPLFGGAEASSDGKIGASSGSEITYEEVPLNLELPQPVADLLKRVNCSKWVVLENFHYLSDEAQKEFAFDLRAFQELGVRFVILGVWREKNRMAQFNGDLLDRTIEIPVEPWTDVDFKRVCAEGSKKLNIKIDNALLEKCIEVSFSSIGVFQELLKHICISAGVTASSWKEVIIDSNEHLKSAISVKTNDYGARHERALEAIAAGHMSGGQKGDQLPLYLPYYLVRTIVEHGFEGIANGARKQVLWDWIRAIHHRGQDVRSNDMTNLLGGLAHLQSAKSISPPIFAYDAQQRILQVVDSTFYFFIKNVDPNEVVDSIQNPVQDQLF